MQVVYLKNGNFFTTGFSRIGERQYGLWNQVLVLLCFDLVLFSTRCLAYLVLWSQNVCCNVFFVISFEFISFIAFVLIFLYLTSWVELWNGSSMEYRCMFHYEISSRISRVLCLCYIRVNYKLNLFVDIKLWLAFLWRQNLTNMTVQEIDTSNGIIFPFYDPDTNMIYLCGKVGHEVYLLCLQRNWCLSWYVKVLLFLLLWFEFLWK